MIRNSAIVLASLLLAGCQTAQRTSKDDVRVIVSPKGAQVTTSLGISCTAPCTIKAPRARNFTVTASRKGYKSQTVEVKKKLNKDSFKKTLVSGIVPGGSILIATDTITGSNFDHKPNPVRIRLKRR